MSQESSRGGGRQPAGPGHHHISSIAHLFFAEDIGPGLPAGSRTELQLAVTCFNESRIAAFACGKLVDGTRRIAASGETRAVRLLQEPGLVWAARSFLGTETVRADGGVRPDSGSWSWPSDQARVASTKPVCWTQLETGRERGQATVKYLGAGEDVSLAEAVAPPVPGRDGLVACLLAQEVGELNTGVALGRILGQLAPSRLEVLVFPDSWAADRASSRGGWPWKMRSGDRARDLLIRCRNLTRALGAACPVTITNLAGEDRLQDSGQVATVLESMALRLVADFWLDPTS